MFASSKVGKRQGVQAQPLPRLVRPYYPHRITGRTSVVLFKFILAAYASRQKRRTEKKQNVMVSSSEKLPRQQIGVGPASLAPSRFTPRVRQPFEASRCPAMFPHLTRIDSSGRDPAQYNVLRRPASLIAPMELWKPPTKAPGLSGCLGS